MRKKKKKYIYIYINIYILCIYILSYLNIQNKFDIEKKEEEGLMDLLKDID